MAVVGSNCEKCVKNDVCSIQENFKKSMELVSQIKVDTDNSKTLGEDDNVRVNMVCNKYFHDETTRRTLD